MKNLLTEWARLLIFGLAEAGIRDVVVSPGSRSTPFVAAALEHPGLRCHRVMDERSAGFVALGQARATGRPSLLLCTSGTAGLHYLPALLESAMAHHPLLILTADRPMELQACGAPQTIDQVGLYGAHVRRSFELGSPDPDPRALRGLVRTAVQATFSASHPLPGPVHINARVRKPLEPAGASTEPEATLEALARSIRAEPMSIATVPESTPSDSAIQTLASWCRASKRGVVVAGPASADQQSLRGHVATLSTLTDFPVLAEVASQLRVAELKPISSFDALVQLDDFGGDGLPDLVIQLGPAPTSAAWSRFVDEHRSIRRVVLTPWAWPDPHNSADLIVVAGLRHSLRALCTALAAHAAGSDEEGRNRADWMRRLQTAELRARRIQDDLLDASSADADVLREDTPEQFNPGLREASVVRTLVASLPDDALLVTGNSLAIRHLDSWVPLVPPGVTVLSQRGANGIDGLVSGGLGAALASGRPTAVLLGDVSLLHDLSALTLSASSELTGPLVVVTLNNDGGRIFEQLPIADTESESGLLDFWTTPHGVDLASVARALGLPGSRIDAPAELEVALEQSWSRPGLTMLEARVPPHGAAEDCRSLVENLADADVWHDGAPMASHVSGAARA